MTYYMFLTHLQILGMMENNSEGEFRHVYEAA
jgi:hypothetical protein